MEFINFLSSLAVVGVLAGGIIGLIKPSAFEKQLKSFARRKHIFIGSIIALFAFSSIAAATTPPDTAQANLTEDTAVLSAEEVEPVVEVKTVTETEVIKFETEEKDDSSLASGKTKVAQEGKNGEKTLTYEVTYTDGVETGRTLKSEEVTTKPVNKIVANGTYVASTPAPAPSSTMGVVKKSSTGICHAPGTTYYDRTKNFTPYQTVKACLDSGGRLPLR